MFQGFLLLLHLPSYRLAIVAQSKLSPSSILLFSSFSCQITPIKSFLFIFRNPNPKGSRTDFLHVDRNFALPQPNWAIISHLHHLLSFWLSYSHIHFTFCFLVCCYLYFFWYTLLFLYDFNDGYFYVMLLLLDEYLCVNWCLMALLVCLAYLEVFWSYFVFEDLFHFRGNLCQNFCSPNLGNFFLLSMLYVFLFLFFIFYDEGGEIMLMLLYIDKRGDSD